jgi:hypothetical protein
MAESVTGMTASHFASRYTGEWGGNAMPLRDHFNPPLAKVRSWDELHGLWPGKMVDDLSERLPPGYYAASGIHLGACREVDIAAMEPSDPGRALSTPDLADTGATTAVYSPPLPALELAGLPGQDEYEVCVYDERHERRLVAAIEIVSPSNKDRPDSRGAFVAKCAELVRRRVTVAIVDVVTTKRFNLFAELLELIDREDPSLSSDPPSIYAHVCRSSGRNGDARFAVWPYGLAIGQPLPTLPIWLDDDTAVPLDLEHSYQRTCRVLRMP